MRTDVSRALFLAVVGFDALLLFFRIPDRGEMRRAVLLALRQERIKREAITVRLRLHTAGKTRRPMLEQLGIHRAFLLIAIAFLRSVREQIMCTTGSPFGLWLVGMPDRSERTRGVLV